MIVTPALSLSVMVTVWTLGVPKEAFVGASIVMMMFSLGSSRLSSTTVIDISVNKLPDGMLTELGGDIV